MLVMNCHTHLPYASDKTRYYKHMKMMLISQKRFLANQGVIFITFFSHYGRAQPQNTDSNAH